MGPRGLQVPTSSQSARLPRGLLPTALINDLPEFPLTANLTIVGPR